MLRRATVGRHFILARRRHSVACRLTQTLGVMKSVGCAISFWWFSSLLTPSYAAEAVYSFVLPSGVAIRIIEGPFSGRPDSFCPSMKRNISADAYRPMTYVKSIQATYEGRIVDFEVDCMTDAWNGRPLSHGSDLRYFGGWCEVKRKVIQCAFRGIFSDGSEGYVTEWTASGNRAKRTVFSSASDLTEFFFKNIDPPRF